MSSFHSRFEDVSRRAFMTRSLLLGALVVAPGLACSNDDKQTFANSNSTSAAANGSTATTTAASTAASTADTSASAPTSTPGTTATAGTAGTATTSAAAAAGTFPTGGQMTIGFTYTAAGGGQVHSPFIAVWIENSSGEMVKTVSLWYKNRESRYLNELQRWATTETAFQNAGSNDPYDTVSSATRVAGTYSVMWDGTNATGAPVALGQYYVCVEAAREKGPYELVRGPVAIDGAASTTTLTDNGELTGVSVQLVA
ncbi:MAG: hypothetical protein JWL72_144 [Ilumatobacteraceae bacterium]|nr:hypothetical protein [Ilumatobacteraceae bacterium]